MWRLKKSRKDFMRMNMLRCNLWGGVTMKPVKINSGNDHFELNLPPFSIVTVQGKVLIIKKNCS